MADIDSDQAIDLVVKSRATWSLRCGVAWYGRPLMRRALPALVVALLAGCGGTPASQEGASVHVVVQRLAAGDDCVRLVVSDAAVPARQEVRVLPLTGRPAATELVVGVVQPDGYGRSLEVVATLHLGGCAVAAIAQDSATFEVASPVTQVTLTLREPGAGSDGGTDAGRTDSGVPDAGGTDAGGPDAGGPDAGGVDAGGMDAGVDAGQPDAGGMDAGTDAGTDAGAPDAGQSDAGGMDAGPPDAGGVDAGAPDAGACTGAVRTVRTTGPTWNDLAVWGSQGVIAVGASDSIGLFAANNSFTDWGGSSCTGDFGGVWVHPMTFQPYAITGAGFRRVDGPGQCVALAALPAGTPHALTGIRVGTNTTRLYAAVTAPATVVELDVGTTTAIARAPPSAGAVYDVDGLDEDTLWAVGNTTQNDKGAFWRWNVTAQAWDSPVSLSPANSVIYAVDVVSNVLAFAGGADGLYRWNGASWSGLGSPGFEVRGVRALSDTEVYVVGPASGGNVGFAKWNGTSFSSPTRPTSSAALARVRGVDGCSVWAVGASLVVTTEP